MRSFLYGCLLAVMCTAQACAAGVDPNVQAKAEEWMRSSITGQWNRTDLTPRSNARLTPALERSLVSSFKSWGQPKSFTYEASEVLPDYTIYSFLVTFSKNRVTEIFTLDRHGRLASLLLPPAFPHLTQAQM